jgi:hypothetical protein
MRSPAAGGGGGGNTYVVDAALEEEMIRKREEMADIGTHELAMMTKKEKPSERRQSSMMGTANVAFDKAETDMSFTGATTPLAFFRRMCSTVFITLELEGSSTLATYLDYVTKAVIILAIVAYLLSTDPQFQYTPLTCAAPFCSDDAALCPGYDVCEAVELPWITAISNFTTYYFTAEWGLKMLTVWSVSSRVAGVIPASWEDERAKDPNLPLPKYSAWYQSFKFFWRIKNIIDFASIFPSYVQYFSSGGGASTNFVRTLRLLRLIRVLRLLRLLSFLKNVDVAMDLIWATLSEGSLLLSVFIFVCLVIMVLLGCLCYIAEQGTFTVDQNHPNGAYLKMTDDYSGTKVSNINSAVQGIYWSVGVFASNCNISPVTPFGKFLQALNCFMAIMAVAFPAGVIGSELDRAYRRHYKRLKEASEAKEKERLALMAEAAMEAAGKKAALDGSSLHGLSTHGAESKREGGPRISRQDAQFMMACRFRKAAMRFGNGTLAPFPSGTRMSVLQAGIEAKLASEAAEEKRVRMVRLQRRYDHTHPADAAGKLAKDRADRSAEKVTLGFALKRFSAWTFLLLEYEQSSQLAKMLSLVTKAVIMLAVVTYIIGTDPMYQVIPSTCDYPTCSDDSALCPGYQVCEPEEDPTVTAIEDFTTYYFTVEYVLRLLLCWSVTPRIAGVTSSEWENEHRLNPKLEQPKYSAWTQSVIFFWKINNMIDFASIFPCYIKYFTSAHVSTNFVRALRLFRLVRVLRLLKLIAFLKNVDVAVELIFLTLSQSTLMLSVFMFFIAVILILFGCLQYMAQQGTFTVNQNYPNGAYLVPTDDLTGLKVRSPHRRPPLSTIALNRSCRPLPTHALSLALPLKVSNVYSASQGMLWAAEVGLGNAGEINPTTDAGKALEGFLALFGVIGLAFPISVVCTELERAQTKHFKRLKSHSEARERELLNEGIKISNLGFTRTWPVVSTLIRICHIRPSAAKERARMIRNYNRARAFNRAVDRFKAAAFPLFPEGTRLAVVQAHIAFTLATIAAKKKQQRYLALQEELERVKVTKMAPESRSTAKAAR